MDWSGSRRRALAAVLCIQLVLVLLTGCVSARRPALMGRKDPLDPYIRAVADCFKDYRLKPPDEDLYYTLTGGGMLEVFDAQAEPAIRQGVGNYWYPQCLATVVIALDRDRTGAQVTGWRDLLEAGNPVCWCTDETMQQLVLGALCYGLEGEDYSHRSGLDLLEILHQRGLFARDDWQSPILICFDYQAVDLMEQGRNLEIVVPQEGTFSYALGLLSNHLLNVPTDEVLLGLGLRLVDGRCRNPLYPEPEAYAAAVRVEDLDQLLEETADTVRDIRRHVTHRRYLSTADGREHVMGALVGVVLALFWMGTAMHRSIRRDIQRGIQICALLVVGWLTVRLLKYQLPTLSLANRLCWYGFYIFMPALPLAMLYIACIFDQPEAGGRPNRWFRPVAWLYPALVLLVFTNDFHQLVFRFDPQGTWDTVYTYGPGYAVIFGYCTVIFLASFVILIRKSWKSPKRIGWMLPAFVGLLILGYCVAYTMGVSLVRDSDLTLIICTFAVAYFEAALHTGLIPANTRYGELFQSSPLDMQLLDDKGRTVIASSGAAELEPLLRLQLQSKPGMWVSYGRDQMLFSRAIHGGTVVWREDLSVLNGLHRDIRASVERLQAANTLLSREEEVRRRRLAADLKVKLFTSLEKETEARTAELSQAIRTLPQAKDRPGRIAYITLLLCHIKRRCNLFFLTQEGERLPGVELAMYLDELSEFAGYAGVHALVRCSAPDTLEVQVATLCYDFYFAALSWSVREEKETLLGRLEEGEEGLCFSILTGERAAQFPFPPALEQAVEAAGGSLCSRMLEDTAGLYLSFPKGGKVDG